MQNLNFFLEPYLSTGSFGVAVVVALSESDLAEKSKMIFPNFVKLTAKSQCNRKQGEEKNDFKTHFANKKLISHCLERT